MDVNHFMLNWNWSSDGAYQSGQIFAISHADAKSSTKSTTPHQFNCSHPIDVDKTCILHTHNAPIITIMKRTSPESATLIEPKGTSTKSTTYLLNRITMAIFDCEASVFYGILSSSSCKCNVRTFPMFYIQRAMCAILRFPECPVLCVCSFFWTQSITIITLSS